MKKPMKKGAKIALIVFVAAALIGVCFTAVGLYAKKELSKEKFVMPEQEPLPSAEELPVGKESIFEYAAELYDQARFSDAAEASLRTDARVDADYGALNMPDADKDVIRYISDGAGEALSGMYESVSGVKCSESDLPRFPHDASELLEASAKRGDDNGEQDDRYFIEMTFDPREGTYDPLDESFIFEQIREELSPALTITSAVMDTPRVFVSETIDRVCGQLLKIEVRYEYPVSVAVEFTGDYAALGSQNLEVTFTAAHKIEFLWYGARFFERAIVLNPSDMKALPAKVTVNPKATKEDYDLTFTPSDPDVITIDKDGVARVASKINDETMTIAMKLEYEGKTYTDELTVYLTNLEEAAADE